MFTDMTGILCLDLEYRPDITGILCLDWEYGPDTTGILEYDLEYGPDMTCILYLKKGQMPPMCHKNKLEPPEVPKCLKDLTILEKQLIVKVLFFIKVRYLPKTRMKAMNDSHFCSNSR